MGVATRAGLSATYEARILKVFFFAGASMTLVMKLLLRRQLRQHVLNIPRTIRPSSIEGVCIAIR